jgi:hypothetical protein
MSETARRKMSGSDGLRRIVSMSGPETAKIAEERFCQVRGGLSFLIYAHK